MPIKALPLLADFNHPDTILVISKYPYAGNSASFHGVATYTQDTLRAISETTKKKFVVLVQSEYDRPMELDPQNKNILIVPAFDAGLRMFAQLFKWVTTFNQVSLIHIHSEFYTSGHPLQMALVVPFVAALKLAGKQVYFTAHNVVNDFSFIANHLGKKRTDVSLKILEKLTPWYYAALGLSVTKLIVLDESVAQKISRFMQKSKLVVSPHWIHPQKTEVRGRQRLRQKYGFTAKEYVLVCYGFMTNYKGIDWLIEAVEYLQEQHPDQTIKLVLAGGKAPSQEGKAHYERFYTQLAQRVAKSTQMVLTGFIPEKQVKNYFSLADIVVLPYRGILGASGSWAQAMAHGKPFLLSEELSPYLTSADAVRLMDQHGLAKKDLVFRRHKKQFASLVTGHIKDQKLATLAEFSKAMAQERSATNRIAIEIEQLYTPQAGGFSLQLNRAPDIA